MSENTLENMALEQAITPQGGVDDALLEALLLRVVDKDQDALAMLYDQLLPHVYGLALRITRTAELAEEVAQDTFWQVWRQAPRFDPARGTAKTWVLTMARSRALDALRKLALVDEPMPEEALMSMLAPDAGTPPDLLLAVQQGQHLHTALASLDELPRQLLALAFFRGLSHEEIAEVSGLPLGTVKSHIRRALLALKHLLTTDAAEEKGP